MGVTFCILLIFSYVFLVTTFVVVNLYCYWVLCVCLWQFYLPKLFIIITNVLIITIILLIAIIKLLIDMDIRGWVDWCMNGVGGYAVITHSWGMCNTTVIIRINYSSIDSGNGIEV